MRDFSTLEVWGIGHELVLALYRPTKHFPREELYGIVSQIRRAGASIPMNIAEGCGRCGEAEVARFMQIAIGSASELEYSLLLARDLEYLGTDEHQQLHRRCTQIKRLRTGLTRRLSSESNLYAVAHFRRCFSRQPMPGN